jgi:hypothetical protein
MHVGIIRVNSISDIQKTDKGFAVTMMQRSGLPKTVQVGVWRGERLFFKKFVEDIGKCEWGPKALEAHQARKERHGMIKERISHLKLEPRELEYMVARVCLVEETIAQKTSGDTKGGALSAFFMLLENKRFIPEMLKTAQAIAENSSSTAIRGSLLGLNFLAENRAFDVSWLTDDLGMRLSIVSNTINRNVSYLLWRISNGAFELLFSLLRNEAFDVSWLTEDLGVEISNVSNRISVKISNHNATTNVFKSLSESLLRNNAFNPSHLQALAAKHIASHRLAIRL